MTITRAATTNGHGRVASAVLSMAPCPVVGCDDTGYWRECQDCADVVKGCDSCGRLGRLLDEGPCPLCGGARKVRAELVQLYDAFTIYESTVALGGIQISPRTTLWCQAEYFRRRAELREAVRVVRGRSSDRGSYIVEFVTGPNEAALTLVGGLAWGYVGRAPDALASILADVLPRVFPTRQAALRWTSETTEAEWHIPVSAAPYEEAVESERAS